MALMTQSAIFMDQLTQPSGCLLRNRKENRDRITPAIDLLTFFMEGMLSAEPAILVKFQLVRGGPFVFRCGVISPFTLRACKGNNYSHLNNSFAIQ
jgi:hypothetical protein